VVTSMPIGDIEGMMVTTACDDAGAPRGGV